MVRRNTSLVAKVVARQKKDSKSLSRRLNLRQSEFGSVLFEARLASAIKTRNPQKIKELRGEIKGIYRGWLVRKRQYGVAVDTLAKSPKTENTKAELQMLRYNLIDIQYYLTNFRLQISKLNEELKKLRKSPQTGSK